MELHDRDHKYCLACGQRLYTHDIARPEDRYCANLMCGLRPNTLRVDAAHVRAMARECEMLRNSLDETRGALAETVQALTFATTPMPEDRQRVVAAIARGARVLG